MPVNRRTFVLLCRHLLVAGTAVALTVPAASVATLDLVPPDSPVRSPQLSLVAAEAVSPVVREVPVHGVERTGLRTLAPRSAGARRALAAPLAALSGPETVHGYATVGVTWKPGAVRHEEDITVSVRTREDGSWSGWQELPYDADHGPDPGSAEARDARPGTEPLIVGDVDDVQVKAVTDSGRAPADMRLALVDPGEAAATTRAKPAIDTAALPSAARLDAADGAGDLRLAATTAARATPRPQIYSRAQWGADERLREGSPSYYEVHAGFVHHTVNANDYTRAQVPSLLRGIYAYHTQSRGWSDIGYNFVVDRFGRIWEGRAGGVDRPVVGAHTLGYNEYSFAMSALGNFEQVRPSRAMVRAYGRLFAWKLSLHGVDAGSMDQWVGSRSFAAINGHRDAGQTACPGRYLYAKIDRIRALAVADQVSFEPRARTSNLSGSSWPDLVVRDEDSHRAFVVRTGGQLDFGAGRLAARGFVGMDLLTAAGDVTGDGVGDLVARAGSTKAGGVYPGTARGRFGPLDPVIPRTLRNADVLTGVGDMSGDGLADLVLRNTASQRLVLARGRGDGTFRKPLVLADDWSAYELTFGAGDLDGDGANDLLARDRDGRLWLVPGTGHRAIGTPQALPGRWGGYDLIAGMGDATGDGRADLVVRAERNGLVYLFPGDGQGGFGHRYGPFDGYRDATFLTIAGQVRGTAAPDLLVRRGGRLVALPGNGRSNVDGIVRTGTVIRHADLLLDVGDWNGDGRGDLMSRSPLTGRMYFRAGLGANRFGAPVLAGRHWDRRQLVSAVGDVTGDGHPDVMAQPRGGEMRIYPGNGRAGFRRSYVAHSAIAADAHLGIGLWTSDGAPDSLLRRTDGSLVLYPGNGPGGLTNPETVGAAAGRYDWLRGAGDVDGDGDPDVLARARATGVLWLLPGSPSGFERPRYVGEGFERFDLSG